MTAPRTEAAVEAQQDLIDAANRAAGTPRTEAGRALVEWAENAYPGQDQVHIWRDHALAIEAEAAAPSLDVEALPFRDELAEAEHEVAARLHVYLWGKDVPHQDEPEDGSDCQMCWDETNGLFYGTIVPAVEASERRARLAAGADR